MASHDQLAWASVAVLQINSENRSFCPNNTFDRTTLHVALRGTGRRERHHAVPEGSIVTKARRIHGIWSCMPAADRSTTSIKSSGVGTCLSASADVDLHTCVHPP